MRLTVEGGLVDVLEMPAGDDVKAVDVAVVVEMNLVVDERIVVRVILVLLNVVKVRGRSQRQPVR